MSNTGIYVLGWASRPGRLTELSDALDASTYLLGGPSTKNILGRLLVYLRNCFLTALFLFRKKSRFKLLIIQIPPWPLYLLIYILIRKVPFLVDAHPGAFGDLNDKLSLFFFNRFKHLLKKADLVLVANEKNERQLLEMGVQSLVFGECFLDYSPPTKRNFDDTVLIAWTFGKDDPIEEMLNHIDFCSFCPRFRITGQVPHNYSSMIVKLEKQGKVILEGYVSEEHLRLLMTNSVCTLSLTLDPNSRIRIALEAAWYGGNVVTTDSLTMRDALPFAVFVDAKLTNLHEAINEAKNKSHETKLLERQHLVERQASDLLQLKSKILEIEGVRDS
jgi:hypothetical protein